MDELHKEIKKQLLHQLMKHMDKDNGSRLGKIMRKPGKDIEDLAKRPSDDLIVHNDNKDIQDMKAPIVKDAMNEPKKEAPDMNLQVTNPKKKNPFKK